MTIYRSMRAGPDGLPRIERKRWGLGVRIGGPSPDLDPAGGMVGPLGGGLSVTRDWHDLEPFAIPRELGGTNDTETLFALEEDALPPDLNLRLREPPKGHYELEPRRMMPIQDYEALLAGTQQHWRPVGPGT